MKKWLLGSLVLHILILSVRTGPTPLIELRENSQRQSIPLQIVLIRPSKSGTQEIVKGFPKTIEDQAETYVPEDICPLMTMDVSDVEQ